ncbi:MAG: PSD1 domain-containing protein [Verrucomicrobiales bacterium]|nr:PSD1 domain-containing protein [Verrucomicrobiales bacterium]
MIAIPLFRFGVGNWGRKGAGMLAVLATAFRVANANDLDASAKAVSFNQDIRPILSDHCFACHGPDEKTRKSGLRLDLEDEARKPAKSGKVAVVPGSPENSELLARIRTHDAADRMPPDETKKPLSEHQISLLSRWIAEGAKFEGHWAYLAPVRHEPPAVKRSAWPKNDVDRFVLARLEKEGLTPQPEASKERLLRRVTLDLTGLPPTVEELEAFLADPEDKAYDKVVDRLLSSKHYGERMAQQWLDLARYGETQGYHHDRHRDLWRWRDWVIRAFNENQPFDQFTVEQLAGDLMPSPTRDQLIATGFHRNEMTTSEGGALPEEYIVKYAVGRVDTTARVWLGTSMACAECHDHKYDPITQKEYYQFFAFFFDTPENGLDAEELNPVPRITLETPEQRARADQLDREVASLETAERMMLESANPDWDRDLSAWEDRHREGIVRGWEPLGLKTAAGGSPGAWVQRDDGTLAFERRTNSGPDQVLTFRTTSRDLAGLRLEVSTDGESRPTLPPYRLAALEVIARASDPAAEARGYVEPQWGPWQWVGPFPANAPKEAFDREFGPERNTDRSAVYDEGRRRWSQRAELIDGKDWTFEGKPGAVYAARQVIAKDAVIVEVELGHRYGVRVWLNERPIHTGAGTPDPKTAMARDRVRLWLQPGENRLLVKYVTGENGPHAMLQVLGGPVLEVPIEISGAAANPSSGDHPIAGAIDRRPETAWQPGGKGTSQATAYFRTAERFGFRHGTELEVRLTTGAVGDDVETGRRYRWMATRADTFPEFVDLPDSIRMLLSLEGGTEGMTPAQRLELRRFYRERSIPEAKEAKRLLAAKRKERDDERRSWPTAMVMRESSPTRETQVRIRGQYDQKGEKVSAGVPSRLFPWGEGLPRNRLGLARWLTDPRHPLTSRVVVNQYWQRYFGTGLVKSSEDFGAQGEWPSHPELLDWLATEFVRTGWDIKAMQRLLVTSATYRQNTRVTQEVLDRDPENRLMARGPRFRLDAENIRDVALAASGLMNPQVGGPSVFPYQPPGLWGQVSFEGTRDYVQSVGPDNYRRGLYTYWRRSIPYAAFTVFDAPSREVCTVRRPRTNTPLQALALLNDPVYVEAARALAQRILAKGGPDTDARLRYAFRLVLGRDPTPSERAVLAAACTREFKRFAGDRESANRLIHVGASTPPVDVDIAELAAWTVVANTLLNLDETITRG